MANEQMMQAPPQQEGAGAVQDLLGSIQGQVEGLMQGSQAFAQAGAKGAGDKLAQAAQLIQAAVEEVAGGGAQPAEGEIQSPDTAGTGAQPATIAGR